MRYISRNQLHLEVITIIVHHPVIGTSIRSLFITCLKIDTVTLSTMLSLASVYTRVNHIHVSLREYTEFYTGFFAGGDVARAIE